MAAALELREALVAHQTLAEELGYAYDWHFRNTGTGRFIHGAPALPLIHPSATPCLPEVLGELERVARVSAKGRDGRPRVDLNPLNSPDLALVADLFEAWENAFGSEPRLGADSPFVLVSAKALLAVKEISEPSGANQYLRRRSPGRVAEYVLGGTLRKER